MCLIDNLVKRGHLQSDGIINAFKKIKRRDFVREQDKEYAEVDEPLPIGYGQTISQPLTVAFMIELLKPEKGDKVLDVGSGSGWTTALLSEIVEDGKVYGIESIPKLKEFGEKNVSKYNFIKKGVVEFVQGNGSKGLPDKAPFDRILVSASAVEVPKKLKEQLNDGGRMVIPVRDSIYLIEKKEGKFKQKEFFGFNFVPLKSF